MRIGKIFYIFNILLVIKLLESCLCNSNKSNIATLPSDELEVNKKNKQKIILYSILGVAAVVLSAGLGYAYGSYRKKPDLSKLETEFKDLKNQLDSEINYMNNMMNSAVDDVFKNISSGVESVKKFSTLGDKILSDK